MKAKVWIFVAWNSHGLIFSAFIKVCLFIQPSVKKPESLSVSSK